MKNKIGLISGFMVSVFVHFGILLFAFLFLKEQAPIQKELFHSISLNDYIVPQVEQKIEQSAAQIEPEKAIEKEQIAPKKVQPKPMPKNIKNSQIPKSSKTEQTAQNNAINNAPQKENLAQSLAKEQDKIAAQIYKIISAYIIKNYPKDALRRNQSGSVLVSFNYNSSGVSNAQILQSSNIKSLDKASLDAIEKTKHLFPKTNKNFAFTLPVSFAIK
ncbi:MAG: energy transducer TonB [Campylobacter sp.]|uniref:energy transducer TonB family protein n=1 Tax=Campylobacter sp. TaxID=205 RepID=UPI002AA72454|nr:energy transducer TonB [Campylobacter sp.]MCI6343097.1 energy transducer TonB [Campylobacter sp.]MCI6694506.1 energy transducer TonB [Campylobacter sp.]MCI7362587.1 energy transducer TonB [Campylobacter sp.]MCI7463481.1 energy transducer TonB [Campylobacter sp.]